MHLNRQPTIFSRKDSSYWWVSWSTPTKRIRTSTKFKISEHSKKEVFGIVCEKYSADPSMPYRGGYKLSWIQNTLIGSLEDEGLRDSTIISYRAAVGHLVALYGKDCPVSEIQRRPHVQQIKDHLFEAGLKPPSINKTLRGCRALFERLVDRDIIRDNPFSRFKPVRQKGFAPQHFTVLELKILFLTLSDSRSPNHIRIVRILLYTGRRVSEILELGRGDVDIKGGRFRPMNVKHRDRRKIWVAIPDAVKNDFKYFMELDSEYPFKICTVDGISKWFRKWRRRAGLPESLHLHSLRHTFVTFGLQSGESLWKIKSYLNHSTITVTEGYAHTESVGTVDIGLEQDRP